MDSASRTIFGFFGILLVLLVGLGLLAASCTSPPETSEPQAAAYVPQEPSQTSPYYVDDLYADHGGDIVSTPVWPFPDVAFSYARHNIPDAWAGELSQQASYLLSSPSVNIRITGYSTVTALALRRAQAVRDYLVREGVDSGRIEVVANGGDEQVARIAFVQ